MKKVLRNVMVKAKWTLMGRQYASGPQNFNEAVNFERQAIFVAVPKTGTTSIRKQLSVTGPQMIPAPHLTICQVRDGLYTYLLTRNLGSNRYFPTREAEVLSDAEIRAQAADTFQRFFKFASVRNPWARVVSLYQRREGVQVANNLEFEAFCEQLRYASDTCIFPTRSINQLDWMTDEDGSMLVDYVLRLENLDTGLKEINERTHGRLGLENRHFNSNPNSMSASYRSMYSDKSRKLVAEICRRDIEYFGYEF